MSRMTELEAAVLDLDTESRAKLATILIESLDTDDDVDEAEIEHQWLAEAETRARQIDAGEVELLPVVEALRDLRNRSR